MQYYEALTMISFWAHYVNSPTVRRTTSNIREIQELS
jgi:hypothetical protein